jgi:hypothetical protein
VCVVAAPPTIACLLQVLLLSIVGCGPVYFSLDRYWELGAKKSGVVVVVVVVGHTVIIPHWLTFFYGLHILYHFHLRFLLDSVYRSCS